MQSYAITQNTPTPLIARLRMTAGLRTGRACASHKCYIYPRRHIRILCCSLLHAVSIIQVDLIYLEGLLNEERTHLRLVAYHGVTARSRHSGAEPFEDRNSLNNLTTSISCMHFLTHLLQG